MNNRTTKNTQEQEQEPLICELCYAPIKNEEELKYAVHIRTANPQRLGYGPVHAVCAKDDEVKRWWTGGRVYDWTGEGQRIIEAGLADGKRLSQIIRELKAAWEASGLEHSVYTFEEMLEWIGLGRFEY